MNMITTKIRFYRAMREISRVDMEPDRTLLMNIDSRLTDVFAVYYFPEKNEHIYFSEQFLAYENEGKLSFIYFIDIESSKSIVDEKLTANTMMIFLKNGKTKLIKVSGGDGNNRDFYPFVRFIIRVIEDNKKYLNIQPN